jgi:dipeptidyl aminopeptidase/acylaminoacyl peptidase
MRRILVLLCLTPCLIAASKRPMTVDDALEMVRLDDVLISPDGEKVFYSERRLDWDENKYSKTYFMVPSRGGEAAEFVAKDSGEKFLFSPDGKYLSFLREVKEKKQIFLMSLSGGEARQLTEHKGGIEDYRWTRDGRRIFFLAEETLSEKEQKEWDKGADPVFVDEGPNGKSSGRWRNLWIFKVGDEKEVRLTNEPFIIRDFDVSPDGNRVVFNARRDNRRNYPFLSELYLIDARKPGLRRLTENEAPERNPVWAPDGRSFAYHAPDDKVFELTNGFIWIMDPDTGEARKLEGQNQGEIDDLTWMPDGKSLVFNEVHGTSTNLYRIDLSSDEVTPLTSVTGTLRSHGFSEDRSRMVYSFSDFDTPPDLYTSDRTAKDPVRLTKANPWIEEEIELATGRLLQWKSKDGTEIEGIFLVPEGYREGEKIPLMLHIHGGPSGYFGNEFRTDFHVYAGLGYASLGPNVRGSSAYGDEILRGLMWDVGGGEFDDLMSGVDHVIQMGVVDPDRMGVRGWSWGGVLGGWVVTHTDRFKAASIGAMVCDWTAESGPGFNFDVTLWYIGGTHWDNPAEWRKRSSLTYVKNVTTATLLLHGGADTTSSTKQSLIFFTALRDQGIPARFIKLPRQKHSITEPRLRRIRDVEEIWWMQKYVLGETWKPWVREEPETPRRRLLKFATDRLLLP